MTVYIYTSICIYIYVYICFVGAAHTSAARYVCCFVTHKHCRRCCDKALLAHNFSPYNKANLYTKK